MQRNKLYSLALFYIEQKEATIKLDYNSKLILCEEIEPFLEDVSKIQQVEEL